MSRRSLPPDLIRGSIPVRQGYVPTKRSSRTRTVSFEAVRVFVSGLCPPDFLRAGLDSGGARAPPWRRLIVGTAMAKDRARPSRRRSRRRFLLGAATAGAAALAMPPPPRAPPGTLRYPSTRSPQDNFHAF